MNTTEQRLTAAIAAIHDHLHAGRVDEAHKACECAMNGEQVKQPNLTLDDTSKIHVFSGRFNDLCQSLGVNACFVAAFASSTRPGFTSLQMGGEVELCKHVESRLTGQPSLYQGDHG